MILDFAQDEKYIQWAADKLNINRGYFGRCCTIQLLDETGVPIAVCVYSSYTGVNCEVSVAADSIYWLRKDIVSLWMRYPFDQLGCQRITLLVSDANKQVQRLAQKLGFKQEGTLRHFYMEGNDCYVYGLLKSERSYE